MPSQTAAPPQQQQQLLPGSRFSIPPYTDEVEQPENNDQITTNLSAQSQVPVTGVVPFMQSDIIYGWVYEVSPAHTQTDGTGAGIAASIYAPWIVLGPVLLNMQYQYPSISVATGIDLALINGYRPLVEANRGLAHFKSPITDSPTSQANQNYTTYTHSTGVAQTPTMDFELPAAVWFDSYYELDETGMPVSGPHNGFVSPQNMGGYARVVTPSVRLNPVYGTQNDGAMYVYTTIGTASISGAVTTHGFSRIGVLGSLDQSVLPQPTNWQYNIAHQQVTIAGVSKVSIPLNGIFAGQIMSICCRMFDPAASAGLGNAIPVTAVTNYQLQYGGSVQRFAGGQGTSIKRLQRRFMEQHLYLPMEGVMILDLAVDRYLGVTNSYCLNTLRTAAVQLNLIFSGAQSASAYIEVTIEGLRWVPLPVNPAQ
jgi:hypothetical protein